MKWINSEMAALISLEARLSCVMGKELNHFAATEPYIRLTEAAVHGWPFLIKREKKRFKVVVLKAKIV